MFKVNALSDLTPNSKSAILIEASTGKILYKKDAYTKRSPASMTKMMTLLLTMEALNNGKITLNDSVFVSKNAADMGGSQIFIKENTYITVENLIKGIGIASANDAAVALSEYLGGTHENFVKMMNDKAVDLGCKNTHFVNSHGLDHEGHYSTAYDLSLIAKELVKYEYALKTTSTYEDYIDINGENHWLVNTNKLVRFYKGIDGLKTGYTSKAMYCLTATSLKNDMRLISIVMGVNNKDNRSKDTIALLEYGYSMFGVNKIIDKKIYTEKIYIPNSNNREANYYVKDDVKIITDKSIDNMDYKIETEIFDVKAPLYKNDVIGKIYISYNKEKYEYDLIIKEDIKKSTYLDILNNLFKDIVKGKINSLF